MILVDTSVWIDHLRRGDETLVEFLKAGRVLIHPFVIGELALGNLQERDLVLDTLQHLPQASAASHDEVLSFISRHALFGTGIGYVDAHLLAASRLTASSLWTRDKRLLRAAHELGLPSILH
jgi:hypothetical protein